VIADEAIREGSYVVGANRDGFHLRGVEAGRDFQPQFADIREVREGDTCPRCGGRLAIEPAIEVGHIFKLGTFFSEPLGATYLDESGKERPIVMGSYGIGPGRVMAAVIEQHHDERGIAWPRSIAPYDVHVVALPGLEEEGEQVCARLEEAGRSVLLDDRDLRAGEKFADADLIGCPVRITVGKKTAEEGTVDVRDRATGEESRVAISEIASAV
jgi:prolyl-tRNA synthetase